jgi:hypothetical protein
MQLVHGSSCVLLRVVVCLSMGVLLLLAIAHACYVIHITTAQQLSE